MGRKIAVVEDDRELGKLLCKRLQRAGYDCLLIFDSGKAFPVLKEKKPDLIIMDVMMPKMNGYELCRRVRRDPLIFMTPVLMLSALSGEPEVAHALEQGADDYLVKPFDLGVLFSRVKSLLEKQGRVAMKDPLTGFHGGDYVKRLIANKLFRDEVFASCYFTLANFAPYVKSYGEQKRDEAVALLSDILKEVTQDSGVFECAISHLGGPDFMVLLSVKDFERYCDEVVSRFRQQRKTLYSATELERGTLRVQEETVATDYPIMSVIVGVVTNERIRFRDCTQMVKVAGEVSTRAQQQHNGGIEILRDGMLL